MPQILKNKNIEIHLDLPDEGYNHSRFDRTGKIVRVKYKGKYVSGTEIDDTGSDTSGKGFYNEFGIDSPLGYNDINPGGWFHKIGVGLLKKNETEYDFHKLYEVKPANFEVTSGSDKIKLVCQSRHLNGYSYLLKKEIRLLESGFAVKYYLENKGEKSIITNEYNHNFITIDKDLVGKGYTLKFPFLIRPELFFASVNPHKVVEIGQREVKFREIPQTPFFFSNMTGGEMVNAKWALGNMKSKIGISETGNFRTDLVNLWGSRHVISPELFFSINIRAGESIEWSRDYKIYDLSLEGLEFL